PLIDHLQRALTAKKILTLSFPLPFMQAGKKTPDDMRIMKRAYQAAVALLAQDPSAAPAHVFIGGKNLGALVAADAATPRKRLPGGARGHSAHALEGVFRAGFPAPQAGRPGRSAPGAAVRAHHADAVRAGRARPPLRPARVASHARPGRRAGPAPRRGAGRSS